MPSIRGLAISLLICSFPAALRADDGTDVVRAYMAAYSAGVPSFARQTGLACSACHYQFLTLTPFGRRFKLNGYTLTNQKPLSETDAKNGGRLELMPTAMLSVMASASLTHVQDSLPDEQNDAVAFPQELSLFLSGRLSSKMGVFSQFTYGGADGAIGIDNLDFRFANTTTVGSGTEVVYGVTLHNNPTIQDLWNTTPGWGFPFIGSEGAPAGAAATLIDGGLSQNVMGLGGYTLLGKLVYGELTVYRSAFQGATAPSSATGAIHGVAPYWRLAVQKEWEHRYLMVGTFGLHTSLFPDVLSGPRNTFSDVGLDAQFETRAGPGNLVARGSWIRESQTLDATFAAGGSANAKNTVKTFRLNASYYPTQVIGFTGGYFQTVGTADTVLYAPGPVTGSANGDPKTNGVIGEVDFNPWENTRLGVQYIRYGSFNGLSSNYDGSGRNASGNNTLFLFFWVAF